MNKQEIEALSPQQLQEQIARRLGWTKIRLVMKYPGTPKKDMILVGFPPDYPGEVLIPDWPQLEGWAFDLVNSVMGYFSLNRTNGSHIGGEIHWIARFFAPAIGEMIGETAAMAICRAWLWCQVGKDGIE